MTTCTERRRQPRRARSGRRARSTTRTARLETRTSRSFRWFPTSVMSIEGGKSSPPVGSGSAPCGVTVAAPAAPGETKIAPASTAIETPARTNPTTTAANGWSGALLDPVLARPQRGLGPVAHAEGVEDARHVGLDGLLADAEVESDALVRHPAREQHEDLALARREV